MDTIIKNASIVKPELLTVDIGIEYGRIAAIGNNLPHNAELEIEAAGRIAFPGFIDSHVHFQDKKVFKDTDFRTESEQAILGGITTVVEMPTDSQVAKPTKIRDKIDAIEGNGTYVDFGLHAGNMNLRALDWMPDAVRIGLTSFKGFTCEPYMMRGPAIDMFMAKAKELDALVMFHCESQNLLSGSSVAKAEDYPASRPRAAEVMAVTQVLGSASRSQAEVHIVHVSTAAAADNVAEHRNWLQNLSAEVCLHHLILDESHIKEQGARLKLNPPLRKKEDVDALWYHLKNRNLDFVASDHFYVPHTRKKGKFSDIPPGVPGVDASALLVYTHGVEKREMTLARYQEVMSESQSKRFGMWPGKGSLEVGSDADIVLFDPKPESRFHTRRDWSPYEAMDVKGEITDVFLRGEHAVAEGEITGNPTGKYLFRSTPYNNTPG